MGGAGALAVVGAAGWGMALSRLTGARVAAWAAGIALVVAVAWFVPPRVDQARDAADRTARQAAVEADLPTAIGAAGGRNRVVRCGDPATGRFKVPVLAWRLRRPIDHVIALRRPEGFVFQLRTPQGTYSPLVSGRAPVVAAVGPWRVAVPRCRRLGWDSARDARLPASLGSGSG
jgi:hypothetical protein